MKELFIFSIAFGAASAVSIPAAVGENLKAGISRFWLEGAAVMAPLEAPEPELPAESHLSVSQLALKSRTVTFNSRHYFHVIGGAVWIFDRNAEHGAWEKLAVPPEAGEIREISADGNNLIAVSRSGRIFYMKIGSREWKTEWGKPFSGELYLPPNRGWAISYRGEEAGYEDPDGKFFPAKIRVTTLYVLTADGRGILYADPWLPPRFDHCVDMPLRGRFTAAAISASASTIFIIGRGGTMYTRLADFDTMGNNPAIRYSYEHDPKLRKLPGEGWLLQPAVNGHVTSRITIIQDGRGNAARELRVEGADADGNTGYFTKRIFDREWKFIRTGVPLSGPFLEEEEVLAPGIDRDYPIEYRNLPAGCVLKDFSPKNRLASILVPGLENIPLPFHTRERFIVSAPGEPARLTGVIEIPEELFGTDSAAALVRDLGGRRFSEVFVKVYDDRVELY